MDVVTDSYPYWKAILWCFYPMASLVAIEFFLRSLDDSDDDDQGGGGLMQPVYNPTA